MLGGKDMKIEIVGVGELRCNCYLLDIDGEVLVIDPGDEFIKIKNRIGNRDVLGIVVTHHHFDHVGAMEEMSLYFNVKVYDRNNMKEGRNEIGKFSFDVIYTPGHKEDSICIYFKDNKCMFSGDFIFRGSIGRCDLPGGNVGDMIESIRKIKTYDKDILIYPGHGDRTTLEYEMNNNMYFLDVNFI